MRKFDFCFLNRKYFEKNGEKTLVFFAVLVYNVKW